MSFGRFWLGVFAVLAIGAGLLLLKVFVDQKSNAMRAAMDNPSLASAAPKTNLAHSPAVETVSSSPPSAAKLAPEEVTRLSPSGCLPGHVIAATHVSDFWDNSVQKMISTDIGAPLEVDPENPASGDKCNVKGIANGSPYSGRVALADIAPNGQVQAMLADRAYNRRLVVTAKDLAERITTDLQKRAAQFGIDRETYWQTVNEAVDLIRKCQSVSADQLKSAMMERARTREPNTIVTNYADCSTDLLGTIIVGIPRGLAVEIRLRDDANGIPFTAIVRFERRRDEDANITITGKTVKQTELELFDAYGVGAYTIIQ